MGTLLLSDQGVKCENFDALYKVRKYLYMFCLCLYMSTLSTVVCTVFFTVFFIISSMCFPLPALFLRLFCPEFMGQSDRHRGE